MTQPSTLDLYDWKTALEQYVGVFAALPTFIPEEEFDQVTFSLHLTQDRAAVIEQTANMLEVVAAAYVMWVENDRQPLTHEMETQ